MTPEPSFEYLFYKPFWVDGNLTVNAELDPNVNFFQSISSLDTNSFNIDDTKRFINSNISWNSFSVLHINIRGMQKILEKFQEFFKTLKFNFSTACLSETWCDSLDSTKNSNYRLHGYKSLHQTRDGHEGGGLCIFKHNTLSYKMRSDSNMTSDTIECLCLEIWTKIFKNMILNLNYLPPNDDTTLFEKLMNSIFHLKMMHPKKR